MGLQNGPVGLSLFLLAPAGLPFFPLCIIVFQRELLQKFPLDSFKNFSFALPRR